jgi:hypothetical protein
VRSLTLAVDPSTLLPITTSPNLDPIRNMDGEDRITSLEQALTRLLEKEADTQQKLELLISRLDVTSDQVDPTPPIDRVVLPPTKTDSVKVRSAKPASPPDFDGDHSKGSAFLNSCQTYIRLRPEEFYDEQMKIVWAMSYMKTGRAEKWTARIFRWEQQPENSAADYFLDWENFRDEFTKEFCPAHIDSAAINRLESTAYFQKHRSVYDYLDEFQDLISDSGYTDPKTIVVKFRRGLDSQIQNAIATMASGRPSETNPASWYRVARTVDRNRETNEAFQSTYSRQYNPIPNRPISFSTVRLPIPTPHADSWKPSSNGY